MDRWIGLINRLTAAIADSRDARYIKHTRHDLLTRRVFQIGSGYEDGNNANTLRGDPLFTLAAERAPLEVRSESQSNLAFVFSRQLWTSAVHGGGLCLASNRALGLQGAALATAQPKTVTQRSILSARPLAKAINHSDVQ